MPLFQNSVLNKYLKEQDKAAVQSAFDKYRSYFHNPDIQRNILDAKEEQFQEGFLRELFVKVFGYVLNPRPDYNLTTEYKNEKGAKKADGAILKEGKAVAVIELKSTKTKDLESIRQQAFDYKVNQTGCVYVITSNFQKLRFYINDAVEFEEFDLFILSQERFEILYLCLNSENVLADLPLKIKNASLLEEEKITKKFYADYSSFKKDLFESMVNLNMGIEGVSKLLLYKKTQKLLDRFLFIFFAEDRGLLPPNSISRMIKRWNVLKDEDAYKPLYDIFRQYFGYLNKGRKGKIPGDDIHEYNGGLFLTDELLDKIEINDNVLLRHTSALTNYDFESSVDVNILGHIFEHSLNEIESTTAELEGVDFDKQKSKRKKDGVFYTPKYITKYIVDNTVGKLCEEKKAELGIKEEEFTPSRQKETKRKLLANLEKYRSWLLELTICDPACGSGAFLNQALEYLISEHHYIDDLNARLFGSTMVFQDVENQILENNIFGVDINEESVDIARLSLWLRTAQRGRKLTTLNKNIKCGNSLIDDPEVAGDKAFKWENEFPEVFAKGGFDVVIGNPPYVFAREKISQKEKDFFSMNYNSADYQVNTYLLFVEKAINLIKTNAFYGLIVPNAWLMIYSGQGLRKYILDTSKLNHIINLEGYSFDGVNVETIIILSEKEKISNNEFEILLSKGKEFTFSHTRNQFDFSKNDGFEFKVFSDDASIELTRKLKTDSKNLDDLVLIKAGLKAYERNKGEPKQTVEDVKNRPFDYIYKHDSNTHKYLEGKDVGRYCLNWSGQYLQYGKQLAAPRTFNLFSGEKIIIREITGKYPHSIISTYSHEIYLFNMSNISIIEREERTISLKYILSVLNSHLMAYYFIKNTAKSVRKMFPKIILNDLRKFPFKEISTLEQKPLVAEASIMLELNQQLDEKKNKFFNRVKDNFEIEKISKKLDTFYIYDFKTFVAELKKKKVKLSLIQQDEWEEYFNSYKSAINQLQDEINRTDKEIDRMVYDLYGLTEEEIRLVEESTKQ